MEDLKNYTENEVQSLSFSYYCPLCREKPKIDEFNDDIIDFSKTVIEISPKIESQKSEVSEVFHN